MRKLFVIFIFILSPLSFAGENSTSCGGSCGTRGGGDFLEWSFYDVAKTMVSRLLTSSDSDVQSIALRMTKTLSCLVVEISQESELILDGRSVAAINIPSECKVILSRKSWADLDKDEDKGRLVIHELLPLSGLIDVQYSLSKSITDEYFRLLRRPNVIGFNTFKVFTNSDVFLIPEDVVTLRVTVVGGGGGGGGGHLNRGSAGGGGGGGAVKSRQIFVGGYKHIDVVVGKGGEGSVKGGENGRRGENSSFGYFIVAEGGGGGFSGYYNTTSGYGGVGGGSGGGGGGNGSFRMCSGNGGTAGSYGMSGAVSKNGGAGGAGTAWDSLTDFIRLVSYSPGAGGGCRGPVSVYNGGGGGGGLILDVNQIKAEDGADSIETYGGLGGAGGIGFGAGGGGGTGAEGAGGKGAAGVIYIEYFTKTQ